MSNPPAGQDDPTPPRSSDLAVGSPRRRIGVLGGSFDPIHLGHLHVAHAAVDELGLVEVRFLPAPNPPHKRDMAQTPVELRARMVEMAIADVPHFTLDDSEIRWGGVSYTYDTLVRMRDALQDGDELCFLIGGDSLWDLPKWYRAAELVAGFTLVTVPRPRTDEADDTNPAARDPERDPAHEEALDRETLARLEAAFPADSVARLREHVLRVRPLPISSTAIRARVAAGADLADLCEDVPEPVAREILRRGLYLAPGSILSGGDGSDDGPTRG